MHFIVPTGDGFETKEFYCKAMFPDIACAALDRLNTSIGAQEISVDVFLLAPPKAIL
jgi:hypothetical protein